MFNYLFKSLLIATFLSVLFSCSNKEEHLKLIPKNAGIVANIDLIGLVMKAGVSNFEEYGFIKDLMEKSKNDSIFLHCLPAHRGEEVESDVIDGLRSKVWQQAHNRLYTSKALIEFLLIIKIQPKLKTLQKKDSPKI